MLLCYFQIISKQAIDNQQIIIKKGNLTTACRSRIRKMLQCGEKANIYLYNYMYIQCMMTILTTISIIIFL